MPIVDSYLRRASQLALRSEHPAHKLGCVIAKSGRVLATGFNRLRTHPESCTRWQTLHAETAALIGVHRHCVEGATLYVVRLTKGGKLASSYPCEGCWRMIHKMGIRAVVYIGEDGKAYRARVEAIT